MLIIKKLKEDKNIKEERVVFIVVEKKEILRVKKIVQKVKEENVLKKVNRNKVFFKLIILGLFEKYKNNF